MNKKIFTIYGDSWFEIDKFISSMKILLKFDSNFKNVKFTKYQDNLKKYCYNFIFEYSNNKFDISFDCCGKYKNNIQVPVIQEMLKNGGKPDLVFMENNKIILGIEDTDTSQVGNSSLQRMERIDFFLKNKIHFLYLTYYQSFDRSVLKKQERKPSATQLMFFEKNDINILYKVNQDMHDIEDELLISKYFLNKIMNFKLDYKYQQNIIDNIKREKIYEEIDNFLKINNSNWEWKPAFLNDSPILKGLYIKNKLFTFSSKKTQKVGFVKGVDLINILSQYHIDSRNISPEEIYLLNPVMFIQKKGDKIVKVDPATGEFVFYNKLFKDFKNITLIYSPQATPNLFLNSKCKLSHHIKEKSELVILSNNNNNIAIDTNELSDYNSYNLNNKKDEDDLDFAFYNWITEHGYEDLYISAPCASWSRILYDGVKIIDISKNDKRPDYIFINKKKKIIIIGESKEKYNDLIKYREKHLECFNEFSNKLRETNFFNNYKIIEVNISFINNDDETPNFNHVGILVNKDLSFVIKNNIHEEI